MYAVIKTGAHQYIVHEGETLKVDKIEGNVGDKVVFDNVLFAAKSDSSFSVGTSELANVSVEGVITEQGRDPKIIVFKYKRRKNHKKTRGHRQQFTQVEVTKIS